MHIPTASHKRMISFPSYQLSCQVLYIKASNGDKCERANSYYYTIFLIIISHLGRASQYVYITNGFEPSAINLAMGGNPVSAVNFWNQDPLTSYGNPAFSSLYNGIHYSQSSYKYLDAHGGEMKLDYIASLMDVGFIGIGMVTSIIPGSGTESDYCEITLANSQGKEVGSQDLSDQAEVHGISIDLSVSPITCCGKIRSSPITLTFIWSESYPQ